MYLEKHLFFSMSEDLRNPIVFQCTECGIIVADSFSLIERLTNSLVFTHISNAKIEDKKEVSAEEEDNMCTYTKILCLCGKHIGKKYITVSSAMSRCLGNYAILVNSVRGYQLGNENKEKGEIPFMTHTDISNEIEKLQKFCTYLYNKMYNNNTK